MTLSSSFDVGRLTEIEDGAIETGNSAPSVISVTTNFGQHGMSRRVGMVRDKGVAVGVWSQTQSVQLLFPFLFAGVVFLFT